MPSIFVELKATISEFQAKMGEARTEMEKTQKKGESAFKSIAAVGPVALLAVGTAAVAAGGMAIHMAGDFQSSMTQLVTGAGEAEANLKMVSDGVLALAPKVGETTKQLADGLFMIESAGYHGAAGLEVLKAAAQGAKTGNADLKTVADGVTTLLTDYHLPAQKAADVTSKLVATVSLGKTHMEDLAGALAKVAPAASAVGLNMDQMLGALSTMTGKGTDAATAATSLRQTILQLANPTHAAQVEMQGLGLNAFDVSSHLGERGLTGTLNLLTDAVTAHMGPQGAVLMQGLKASSGSAEAFAQAMGKLPSGAQTSVAALAHLVGGTKVMQAALQLTGGSADTFAQNVKAIGGATADANGNVKGFNLIQQDFNFKLDQARAVVETLAIRIGTMLIPVVEKAAVIGGKMVTWLQEHRTVAIALAAVIGGLLVAATAAWAVSLFMAGGALAFLISPVTLIVLGLAALAAGVVYAYTHWQWFKQAVDAVWSWMKGTLWPGLKAFAEFVASMWAPTVAAATTAWGVIRSTVSDAVNVVSTVVNALKQTFDTVWGAIRDTVKAHIGQIKLALEILFAPLLALVVAGKFLFDNWSTIFAAVKEIVTVAWTAISTAISTAWSIIKPIWDVIAVILKDVLVLAFEVLRAAVEVAWAAISALIKVAWNNIIKPIFDLLKAYIENVLAPVFTWIWQTIIEPTFKLIGSGISDAWNGIIKPVFNDIKAVIENVIAPVFNWLWHNVIEPAWNGITKATSDVWSGIGNLIADGINGAIDVINFFIGAIDTVLKLIPGVHEIGKLSHVGGGGGGGGAAGSHGGSTTTRAMARGGVTHGPALIGEGNPAWHEYVIPTDPTHRRGALSLFGGLGKELGIPGFDIGGIIGGAAGAVGGAAGAVGGAIGDLAGGVMDLASGALDAIRNGAVDGLVAPLLSRVAGMLDKVNLPFFKPVVKLLEDDVVKFIKGQANKVTGGPLLDAAAAYLGVPYVWGGGHGGPLTVAQAMAMGLDCSGLVDQASMAAGIPGLLGTTYQQQRAGSAVANMASSIPGDLVLFAAQAMGESHHVGINAGGGRMINAPFTGTVVRYDSIGTPQYIRRPDGTGGPQMNGTVPFDQGGWLHPGMTMAWNGTGKSERVVGPGGSGGGDVHLHFNAPIYAGAGGARAFAGEVLTELQRMKRNRPSLNIT